MATLDHKGTMGPICRFQKPEASSAGSYYHYIAVRVTGHSATKLSDLITGGFLHSGSIGCASFLIVFRNPVVLLTVSGPCLEFPLCCFLVSSSTVIVAGNHLVC